MLALASRWRSHVQFTHLWYYRRLGGAQWLTPWGTWEQRALALGSCTDGVRALSRFFFWFWLPVALLARIPLARFLNLWPNRQRCFRHQHFGSGLPRAMEAMEEFGVPRQIVRS